MIEAGAGETPLRGGNPGFAGETGDFAHLSEANVRGTDYFGARPLDGGPGGGVNAYPYQLARRRPDAPLFEGVYQTRLEKILARYPDRQAALLPVLNLAQEVRGWVSPEALTRVAEILELSPAYVRGVATFYTMYNLRPVGRYLIQVCTNVCCNVCGADEVYEAFLEALGAEPGEITADGLFTVMEVECLGACGFPTAVQINDRYFENVSVRDVPAVLERLRGEWRTARAQDGEAEDRGVALVAVRPAARAAVAPQTPAPPPSRMQGQVDPHAEPYFPQRRERQREPAVPPAARATGDPA